MKVTCTDCGGSFSDSLVIDGQRRSLHGRVRCFECRPFKRRRSPRFYQRRPAKALTCLGCGGEFQAKQMINGKVRSLYRRSFCLVCSPFGIHNTSKSPPGVTNPEELREHRRRRRNAKTYRYQKKRRKRDKSDLIVAREGRCEDCGYNVTPTALEFHHRDPHTKEFTLSRFSGSRARLFAEALKCDLLCANCHRARHSLRDDRQPVDPVVEHRRRRKVRAIEYMGGRCFACDRVGPPAIFEFHHVDAGEKDFGLSESGIPRRWEKIVAELAKCVMLCANCHREVHAGVREIDEGLLGLAEEAAVYAA